jgi:hypothetical protein
MTFDSWHYVRHAEFQEVKFPVRAVASELVVVQLVVREHALTFSTKMKSSPGFVLAPDLPPNMMKLSNDTQHAIPGFLGW